ncbi:MAG: outer membrane beta-barrel protein [Bacteroidota bacterium]
MHSFDDDKELDQLSKIAAEAIDAPSTANWEKMQRTLDKELPLQKKRRGGIVWWFLPTLLVAGLGYYWLSSSTKQVSINHIDNELKYSKDPITKITSPAIKSSTPLIKGYPNEPIKITAYKQVENNPTNENQVSPVLVETKTALTNNNSSTVIAETTKNIQPISDDSVGQSLAKKPIEITPANQNTKSESKPINKTEIQNKGFFIGLIGGFDASTVKFNYASNVGYNIGGSLGYRFNKHWSVQTGAIYTQKNYKLKGQDFHPPKGSWISYFNIETVDGYCKMWDVPIIATYHFTGNSNGNSFLSLGASSYFMKNENYNYLYFYNNQYYTRTNNYTSTDQHLLGLLHISAGIERPIGKNITSIIEPYAKIPLSGVGFGSIQLSSFGLNFSVQYRQPKK